MWHTKNASAVPKNLGVGVDFRPCSEGDFLTGRPLVCGSTQISNFLRGVKFEI